MSTTYCFPLPDVGACCVLGVENCLNNQTITYAGAELHVLRVSVNTIDHELTVTVVEDDFEPAFIVELLNTRLGELGFACGDLAREINFIPGLIGIVLGFGVLLLPFLIGPLSWMAMVATGILSTTLTIALGFDSYTKAFKLLFNQQKLQMDSLFAVSTLAALIVSIAALFVPGLPMMFDVGLLIFGFRHLGEAIRESLEHRIGLKASFKDRLPSVVQRINLDQSMTEIDLSDLKINDVILIAPGDIVPVDGICLESGSWIYKTIENGCLDPETLAQDEPILAGMTLAQNSQPVPMRVKKLLDDSFFVQRDKQSRASMHAGDKAVWQTEADQFISYFVPAVFLVSCISGVVVGCFVSPLAAIQCAVPILVSACPCAYGLVIGIAVKVGMQKAADHGMIFKSTRKLELVDQIKHVVFDLNGTLTTSVPVVDSLHITDAALCSKEQLLGYFMAIEQHSSKSEAKAICEYASQQSYVQAASLSQEDINATHHAGLMATIGEQRYVLGNAEMMRDQGISVADVHVPLAPDERMVYLARDGVLLGYMKLIRPLRPEAVGVVRALTAMGIGVHIATGSGVEVATLVASQLNIPMEHVRWDCTRSSDAKVNYIRELQQNGERVAMVGDEENDEDAIKMSDFGVAMPVDGSDGGQATANMAKQSADAISRIDSLRPIVAGFEIARQTAANIKQTLIFNLFYNAAALLLPTGLLFAFGITLNPGICAALMIVQTSLILLNTYWFKEQELVYLKEAMANISDEPSVDDDSSYDYYQRLLQCPRALCENERSPRVSVTYSDNAVDGVALSNRNTFFAGSSSSSDSDADIACVFNRMGFTNGQG